MKIDGRLDHNPRGFTSLMDDLEAKIFGRLPDDTWFYRGHGNDSTLGKAAHRFDVLISPRYH